MTHPGTLGPTLLRALPGLAICAMGGAISLVAHGQPAWFGDAVGPGLMAQWLGLGVMALGLVWALWGAVHPQEPQAAGCGQALPDDAHRASGPALLGAVLAFALFVPVIGLVLAAGAAATLAAIGAGERRPFALLVTVLGLTGLTAGIGVVFLPPTAPLWPAL